MKNLPIVAIVGQTNAGKSSLFNRIVGKNQAIVAREEGTTRDRVIATANYQSKSFILIDTAGLKTAEDDFEATIQTQIHEVTELADVIIVVVDGTTSVTMQDKTSAKLAHKTGKPVVLAVNKADNKGVDLSDFATLGVRRQFLISANHGDGVQELLRDVATDLPTARASKNDSVNVALVGRPNAGKSALFNAILKKQQAIVSDKSGTTRDVNRANVQYKERTINLLDTAGIRRPGKIEKGVEEFSILRTHLAIEESDICCLLLDANEYNTKLDQYIAGAVKQAKKGLIIVVSKWDALVEKDEKSADKIARDLQFQYQFVYWAPLIFTSSVTGKNVSKLFDLFLEITETRQQQLETKQLNRWLQTAVLKQPPASRSRQPKLKYITQTSANPPTFTIFGHNTDTLHFSYPRYLENSLRSEFNFDGTTIDLVFENS